MSTEYLMDDKVSTKELHQYIRAINLDKDKLFFY